ncbi:hypothetical protein RCL1_003974 [Eukaryota sp. TZLM3-RCL]
MAKKFYAVLRGKNVGVFPASVFDKSWVEGFTDCKFKGFNTEPEATSWLDRERRITSGDTTISSTPSTRVTFYAVAVGRVPGIYDNYEQCKEQVLGFPGQNFKKFKTREEAEDYLRMVNEEAEDYTVDDYEPEYDPFAQQSEIEPPLKRVHVEGLDEVDLDDSEVTEEVSFDGTEEFVLYTDGSCYNNGKSGAKAGFAFIAVPHKSCHLQGLARCYGPVRTESKTNNTAEFSAVLAALYWLNSLPRIADRDAKFPIEIITDSQLVMNLIKGSWKPSADSMRSFTEETKRLMNSSPLNKFRFEIRWIAGHKYRWNNYADRLANLGNQDQQSDLYGDLFDRVIPSGSILTGDIDIDLEESTGFDIDLND